MRSFDSIFRCRRFEIDVCAENKVLIGRNNRVGVEFLRKGDESFAANANLKFLCYAAAETAIIRREANE